FHTYQGLLNQGLDCKIWEATHATTAALTFFKVIKIVSPGGFGPDYMDAGLRFNNPMKEVRDKARDLFIPNWCICMLISIGTGHPEKVLPLELIRVLQHITTNCESVADELAKEYGNGGVYFRFNVLYRAERVSLDEWEKMSKVMAHMSSYLRGPEVSREIKRVVICL
ncbi:hypothetical protein F5146DRAFT_882446, partial [Armillaria mellea]